MTDGLSEGTLATVKTCGAWNRQRHRYNRAIYRLLMKQRESIELGLEPNEWLEGYVEVTQINCQGKVTGIRYHLRR